jgi:hypothetical protein
MGGSFLSGFEARGGSIDGEKSGAATIVAHANSAAF